MPNTSRLSLPYPSDSQAINVPSDLNTLASAIDTKLNTTTILTTKGDLLLFDGTDPQRLPVGANGSILVADSANANKLAWTADGVSPLTVNGWYRLASNVITGAAATSTVFNSIPGTYTDLMLIWSMVVATGTPSLNCTYNGAAATTALENHHAAILTTGSGTITSQVQTNSSNLLVCAFTTAPTHLSGKAYFPYYASPVTASRSRVNRAFARGNPSAVGAMLYIGSNEDQQAKASGITSITITASVANSIGINSRFSLYAYKRLGA